MAGRQPPCFTEWPILRDNPQAGRWRQRPACSCTGFHGKKKPQPVSAFRVRIIPIKRWRLGPYDRKGVAPESMARRLNARILDFHHQDLPARAQRFGIETRLGKLQTPVGHHEPHDEDERPRNLDQIAHHARR